MPLAWATSLPLARATSPWSPRKGAFVVAVNAVTPFLVYLTLGWFARKSGLVREPFLQEMNQFVFRCFFPITMFYNTHAIQVSFSDSSQLIVVCAGLLVLVVALSVAIVPRLVQENARRGVIIAIFVPVYNVLAIIVLESYRGGASDVRMLVRRVLTNPLFVGGMAGLAFSFAGLHLPDALESSVAKLSAVTTPLAMIILGGTIRFSGVVRDRMAIVATLGIKMLVLPAVAVAICALLGMTQLETFVCFTMYATPVAASAYTMSQNKGGDGELAGELVAISTVVSLGTLFVWIVVLRSMGLI